MIISVNSNPARIFETPEATREPAGFQGFRPAGPMTAWRAGCHDFKKKTTKGCFCD
jgi:hypothetical protein